MKVVVLYTMEGCPYCQIMKEELNKENVFFLERDIDDHQDEFNEFIDNTGVDYVPSMILMSLDKNVKFLAPERDYNEINEGIELVKKYLL